MWFSVKAEIRYDNTPKIDIWDAIWPIAEIVISVAVAIATMGSSAALSASLVAANTVKASVIRGISSFLISMGFKSSSTIYIAAAGVTTAKTVVTSEGVYKPVVEAILGDIHL